MARKRIAYARAGTKNNLPLVVVEKKKEGKATGDIRPCIDFRRFNASVMSDTHPLPIISHVLEEAARCKYFSLIDLHEAFMQIKLRDEDREKIGFTAYLDGKPRQFNFLAVPFGLKNVPQAFQRVLTQILSECSNCVPYIDDVLIYSPDYEQHVQDVKKVVDTLTRYSLRVNFKKSRLAYRKLRVLGHLISENQIAPDPAKTKAIHAWKQPFTKKEYQSFAGYVNYIREYIPNISTLLAVFEKKMMHDPSSAESHACFQDILLAVTKHITRSTPDFSQPFLLRTDASIVGIGAELLQAGKIIGVASRRLLSAEKNYPVWRLEILALVFGLYKFQDYLYGSHFRVQVDNQALSYLKTSSKLPRSCKSYLDFINKFDFDVEFIPGKLNKLADALSRNPVATDINTVDQENIESDALVNVITRHQTKAVPKVDGVDPRVNLKKDSSRRKSKSVEAPSSSELQLSPSILSRAAQSRMNPIISASNRKKSSALMDEVEMQHHGMPLPNESVHSLSTNPLKDAQESEVTNQGANFQGQSIVNRDAGELMGESEVRRPGLISMSSGVPVANPTKPLQTCPLPFASSTPFEGSTILQFPSKTVGDFSRSNHYSPTVSEDSDLKRKYQERRSQNPESESDDISDALSSENTLQGSVQTHFDEKRSRIDETGFSQVPTVSSDSDPIKKIGSRVLENDRKQLDRQNTSTTIEITPLATDLDAAELKQTRIDDAGLSQAGIFSRNGATVSLPLNAWRAKLPQSLNIRHGGSVPDENLINMYSRSQQAELPETDEKRGNLLRGSSTIPLPHTSADQRLHASRPQVSTVSTDLPSDCRSTPNISSDVVGSALAIIDEKNAQRLTNVPLAGVPASNPMRTSPTDLDTADQNRIIKELHEKAHAGRDSIVKELRNHLQVDWPNLNQKVLEVIKRCKRCQYENITKYGYLPPSSETPDVPWHTIQIDLATDFPQTADGYNHVLLLVDRFSGFVLLRPLKTKSSTEVAEKLLQIFSDFGLPSLIQSDHGGEFENTTLQDLEANLDIRHHYGAPDSHRHQGQIERAIRSFRQILNKFLIDDVTQWSQLLPYIQLQMNNTIKSTTNSKPFEIMFAKKANLPSENIWAKDAATRMVIIFPAIKEMIEAKRFISNQYFAAKHKIRTKPFKVGDIVLFRDPHRTSKLMPPWIGPYQVTAIKNKELEISDLADNRKRNTVTVDQLKDYYVPHDEIEQQHYEIEKILAHRRKKDKMEYKIKWKGYPDPTWEPETAFDDVETLRSYHRALRGGV
jgi:hypothetical protein